MLHWLSHKLGLARCPQCETLVDFALEGLEPAKQEDVRRHLSECPSCMEQVRDFLQVNEGLGLCAPECEEPKDFNAKVLARLHQDHNHQEAPAGTADAQRQVFAPRHLGGWPRFWMTLGPVFALLSVVMTLVALGALLAKPQAPASAAAGDPMVAELSQLSREIQSDPKVVRVSLVAAAGRQGSEGSLLLCPGRSLALLKASHLSKCPLGRNYALWAVPQGGQPRRLARFAVEGDGSNLHMLNLSQAWQAAGPVEFRVTQDSGPQAGETWLQGSLRL